MDSICNLCPRNCGIDRKTKKGFCGATNKISLARAALHFWEEPCISMEKGSGAIFFSGCPLSCIYCQNKEISGGKVGKEVTEKRFYEILFELKEKGAENINLVTAGHFLPQIIPSLKKAKAEGLGIPIVYNTSSYEKASAIKELSGIVDIYLPDLKYYSPILSKSFSFCEDYFEIASKAIEEMFRQQPKCEFDENGKMLRGIIVRHLVLPSHTDDSKKVIEHLYNKYGDNIYMSIMSQYTPLIKNSKYPELQRTLTKSEYGEVVDFAVDLGIENAFIQEGEAAKESFIPEFTYEGV